MKKLCFSIAGLFIAFTGFSQNKLDDVLNKVVETLGGKEKLLSVTSIKKSGKGSSGPIKYPINFYTKHNTCSRVDYSFNGLTGFTIVNTDSGYNYNPFGNMAAPERMTNEDVKWNSDDLDLQGHFVNYKEKGTRITLLENEDIDGVDAIQLKVSVKNGKTVYCFIDPDTYYIIRTTAKGVVNGQEQSNTSNYYNFKKTKEGLLFPFTVDNIDFDSIEINTTLDPTLFIIKK